MLDTWTNWAGTVTAKPASVHHPQDLAEAADALTTAERHGLPVRALGSGHSFSPVAAPTGLALDLSAFSGIEHADPHTGLVTVGAGTPLHRLNAELDGIGLAMPNLGDIDRQTIAGALATGTHGTGARFGGLATQVRALQLLLADGTACRCTPDENPELFTAARVGLGALGIVTSITLQCEPAFLLEADEHPEPLDSVLERFDDLAADNDHVEFYWFPYGRTALVKRNNRLPATARPRPLSPLRHFLEYQLVENAAFSLLCRIGRAVPASVRPLNRLSSTALSRRSYSDRSHRVFTSTRSVRFVESEYAVPVASLGDVLRELRAALPRLEHPVMFPVEIRLAAGDDIWLSTAHGRDTAYIAVHQFHGMPYRHWFETFESIVREVGGRPHWGKMHRLDVRELRELYPRFDDFQRVRDAVDPQRRFSNPHLTRVLGA